MAESLEQTTVILQDLAAIARRARTEIQATMQAMNQPGGSGMITVLNEQISRATQLVALYREQERELINLRSLQTSAPTQAAPRSTGTASTQGKDNLALIETKRRALLEEKYRLESSVKQSVNTSSMGITTIFPPGVEDRINKVTAAVIRLNEAENKLRGGTVGGRLEVYNPKAAKQEQFTTDADIAGRLGDMPKATTGIDKLNSAFKEMQKTTGVKPAIDMFTTMTAHANALEATLTGVKDKMLVVNEISAQALAAKSAAGVPGSKTPEQIINRPGAANIEGEAVKAILPTVNKAGQAFINSMNSVENNAKTIKQAAADAAEKQRQAYMKTAAFAQESADMAKRGFTDPQKQFKYSKSVPGGAYATSRWEKIDEDTQRRVISDAKVDPRGNVTQGAIPKAQQSFAQGIGKDVGDLLKWSVAIGAIYGPINAASEAIAQLVVNESALADVSIALDDSLATTSQIFDDVYVAARKSGEAVSNIIPLFGAAFTAAGRISDPIQRYTATLKLMDDALVLSKLSTLDEAAAIDVLTAALYQTAEAPVADANGKMASSSDVATAALSRGRDLIDQWIQVSKIASVSVETLATGVAVLGDSAETAGLSIEQMNALIATISEVSLSSGKETANIAKALIGNYQQESAVKELNRLGIAVVDTTGKTREFLDVMKDVAALRSQKLLGDQDFGRLTLALGGGGIRRQKDVSAFIENFGRMEQIAGMQGGATGSSEEAMAKKLDTVQTAATNLTSSLANLAQSMGTEGGLLDMFSLGIKGATGLVDGLDKIASAVGKVGPLLLGLGVGSIIMRGKGGAAGMQNMLMNNLGMGSMSSGLVTGTMNPMNELLNRGLSSEARKLGGNNMFSTGGTLGRATTLPSMAGWVLPAAQNLMSDDKAEAAGNVIGGVIGAALGGPIGAMAGAGIAEAFVRTTMTYETQFADFFAGVLKPTQAAKGEWGAGGKTPEELTKEAFSSMGGGNETWGKMIAKFIKPISGLNSQAGKEIRNISGGEFKTEGAVALDWAKRNDPKLYGEMMASYSQGGGVAPGTTTRLTTRQAQISGSAGTMPELKAMQQAEQDRLRKQMITGDIKPSDYANRLSSVSAFSTTAPRYMAAMEEQVGGVGDAFKTTEEAYKAFLDILSSGNQESINSINSQIASLDQLQNILDNLNGQTTGIKFTVNGQEVVGDISQLKNAIATASESLGTSTKFSAQQALLQKADLRTPIGGMQQATSQPDVAAIADRAAQLDRTQYSNLARDTFSALQDSWDPLTVLVEDLGDAGKQFVKEVTVGGKNISAANYNAAKAQLEQEGKLTTKTTGGVDWTVSTATEAQIRAAEAKAVPFTAMLQEKGVTGLKPLEETVMTTSEKQTIVAHGDQKVISYLLQQILDTEKKQLQGIWNLPEGASIWVPSQSMIAGEPAPTTPPADTAGDNQVANNPIVTTTTETPKWTAMDAKIAKMDELSKGTETGTATTDGLDWVGRMIRNGKDTGAVTGGMDWADRMNANNAVGTTASAPTDTGVIDQLLNMLKGLFMAPTPTGSGINRGGNGPGGIGGAGSRGGLVFPALKSENAQPLNTRLDLKMTSTTNLMVDGRVLASIVKPYLAADLLKANESGGTVTKTFVI